MYYVVVGVGLLAGWTRHPLPYHRHLDISFCHDIVPVVALVSGLAFVCFVQAIERRDRLVLGLLLLLLTLPVAGVLGDVVTWSLDYYRRPMVFTM